MLSDQEFSDLDDSFWESVSGPENLQNDLSYCDEDKKYASDLQLAAQLGKVLLERNKDLEEQVRQAQVAQYEQVREIELLTKQLEVLRNVNESRMRLYEDVDKNLQDIEKSNEQLRSDIKGDKEKIKTFQRTINELELKCEDLQNQVDNRKDTDKPHPKQQLSDRRSCSVPSLPDAHEIARKLGYEYLGYGIDLPTKAKKELSKHEGELEELKESLRQMKKELSSESRRRREVEKALEEVVTENQQLEDKMMRLEHDHGQLQMEIHNVQVRSIKHSKQSDDTSSVRSGVDDVDIEHDDVDLPGPRARLLRLKSGGSAYGSRESLQNLGLETDEVPHRMQDFEDVPVELNLKTPSTEKPLPSFADAGDDDGMDYSVTLLTELENQYKSLVVKYEAMIESKSKRQTRDVGTGEGEQGVSTKGTGTDHAPGAPKGGTRPRGLVLEPQSDVKPTEAKQKGGAASANAAMAATRMAASLVSTPPLPPMGAAPTVIHRSSPFDLRSPINVSDQGQSGANPPEYKMLFKEIFDTLRKSIVYDDELNKATGTSPAAEK